MGSLLWVESCERRDLECPCTDMVSSEDDGEIVRKEENYAGIRRCLCPRATGLSLCKVYTIALHLDLENSRQVKRA